MCIQANLFAMRYNTIWHRIDELQINSHPSARRFLQNPLPTETTFTPVDDQDPALVTLRKWISKTATPNSK